MKVRIGRRNYLIYALDIETHNDSESLAKRETSMWLGCFINEDSKMDEESSYFYNWDELINKLEVLTKINKSHKKSRGHNIMIYVYNLAFEYSFLLPYLIENGWTWGREDKEKQFYATTTKTCSSVWDILLRFDKDHKIVQFRDLGKVYSGGIREVAKSFGLETQKGEMDYTLNRLHGHIVTKEEKEYCFKDTRIIVEILLKNLERHDIIFFKSLSSSSYACQKMITSTFQSHHPYDKWREDYPYIIGKESDFLRHSVSGGLTQVLPRYQFKDLQQSICHIDANQMHPSSAYLNLFPYGEGTYGRGRPKNPTEIACCHIRLSYNGVKIHSIVCLIGLDAIDDYDLWVWSFEIPVILQCYEHATIHYVDYYSFKTKMLPWRKFYKDNWDARMIARQEGDKFEIMYRKLLNNGSYGKLIEKPHLVEYQNIIDDYGVSNSIAVEREFKDEKDKYNSRFTYIPVGSCIPAYSRCSLIKMALKIGWEKICYTDTDSLFFIDDEETRKVVERLNTRQELGGWKVEEYLTEAQFAVPKRYKATTTEGTSYVKAGGFNFDIDEEEMDFMSVDLISSTWEVKRSYRVKGGTILDVVKKEMNVPSKYSLIYKKNVKIGGNEE